MCIIVDKNTFSGVLDPESLDPQFKPVHKWIFDGKGKIVYGGSKYLTELEQATKYLKIFAQLARARKTIHVSDSEVDCEQAKIEELIPNSDLDDPHLIAIVIISGCRLICTKDSRCHKFVKIKQIYPKGFGVPKFYSSVKQRHLLSNNSIKELCRICKTKKTSN